MRKVRRVPGWQVVIAGVLAANCRFVEEDDAFVHDRAQVLSGDLARYRDAGARSRDDRASLVPILECVDTLGHGQLRAHFGYASDDRDEAYVPIGERNAFRPRPKDREQPVHFKPGKYQRVVSVTFDDSESLTWVLEGREAVADSASARCRDSDSDSHPDGKPCDDPGRCGSHAGSKAVDAGAPSCAGHAACGGAGGSAGSRQTGAAGCDDAGTVPSDAGSCPESAEFAASCSGALRCGPYDGPLHADCSWTCCGKPVSYTVPLRTIAECVRGHWAFSTDPGASSDPCSEPHPCTCSAE